MSSNQTHTLSIVVPIDFNRRSQDIFQRAVQLAKTCASTTVKIIFGCAATPEKWLIKLEKALQQYNNVQIVSSQDSKSQLSKLRNIALAHVSTTYVLFLDVDIIPDIGQIQQALQAVIKSPTQLCMYPCLYLSAKGTKQVSKRPIADFKQYYYQFKREWILHLAFPSSIIICDMQSVREIQGFDERYIGHGYEDFDFMLRLFKHKNLIEYNQQLLVDEAYMAPMMATGFRALLASAQLKQILQPIYFLHAYHSKDQQENYYQLRQQNQILFKTKFTALAEDTSHCQQNRLSLLNQFFQLLDTHNKKPSEFTALWAEIPDHIFRRVRFI